jgi:hypothetical protein
MKKQLIGDILLEHEVVLLKMVKQGLQWGDILNLTRGYLEVHCPEARETYTEDNSHPEFYYGPHRSDPKINTEDT